eukprot:163027_1
MNVWGLISSVGDKNRFKDNIYRKALIRIDPFNDGDIIDNSMNIDNTFDLVSESCSLHGYNGHLVEFRDNDYNIKYDRAKLLCGSGVNYKCFIGMICNKNNGGRVKWISDNVDVINTDFLNKYFGDYDYNVCDQSSLSNSEFGIYYYFIDGSDGKIRRTSFDYNLKDIKMGICETGESQIICDKATFVYSRVHDLSIESALHYYYVHGHNHRNLWPGHMCKTSNNQLTGSSLTPIPYLQINLDNSVQINDVNELCHKKCLIDPFCTEYIPGTNQCLFQTNFDPKTDYTISIAQHDEILSGYPVIESALIGWNCKSNLFERNVEDKILNQVLLIQNKHEFTEIFDNNFNDIGFIWITYIGLNPSNNRIMTEN